MDTSGKLVDVTCEEYKKAVSDVNAELPLFMQTQLKRKLQEKTHPYVNSKDNVDETDVKKTRFEGGF